MDKYKIDKTAFSICSEQPDPKNIRKNVNLSEMVNSSCQISEEEKEMNCTFYGIV